MLFYKTFKRYDIDQSFQKYFYVGVYQESLNFLAIWVFPLCYSVHLDDPKFAWWRKAKVSSGICPLQKGLSLPYFQLSGLTISRSICCILIFGLPHTAGLTDYIFNICSSICELIGNFPVNTITQSHPGAKFVQILLYCSKLPH